MRDSRMRMLMAASVWLATAVACGAQSQPGSRPSYDGRWWRSITPVERVGFVFGYFDCYTFEYKGPQRFLTKSYERYSQLITQVYSDSSRVGHSLVDVIDQLRDKPGEKDENPGGSPTPGRHDGMDGLYWKQASLEGHDKQRGFVEGYLLCHEKLAQNKGGAFSKAPDEYRALVTQWYRLDEKNGDIDAKREPEAIADVLFKVRTGIK